MEKKISVTGIKSSGIPHIGNYFGAIKPALKLAEQFDAFYFIADYHSLNTIKNKDDFKKLYYEVAATWLACGLDPEKVVFYRQSSVPQTFELSIILQCFTPKGLMNRAHAYKSILQKNQEAGNDPDDGVNIGLFTYPILMAADIMQFDADFVPVGKDQKQHVEMAADIAQAINFNYRKELFKVPSGYFEEQTQTIVGLDGRKMSKSYHNTIPLFLPANQLRKLIMRIVTNSQSVQEPKDPDSCNIFSLYKLFAEVSETEALRQRYLTGGMGWGEAKDALFSVMERTLNPMRGKYEELIDNKKYIDQIIETGSEKARYFASKKLNKVRKALGLV